jgi:predicted PurR-regulated permease PerM
VTTWAEWQISAATVVTWLLWVAGMVLICLACVNVLNDPFAALGIAFVAFGCTTQIGSWLRSLSNDHRNAFELGRDSVSQMRR